MNDYKKIISIPALKSTAKESFIFLPGGYQNTWSFARIIDGLIERKNADCYLVNLPGYYQNKSSDRTTIDESIKDISNSIINRIRTKNVSIIGHSLGGGIGCHLSSHIATDVNNIQLYLSCMPISINSRILTIRSRINDLINIPAKWIGRRNIPLFLRGFMCSSYNNKMLNILSDPDERIVSLISVKEKLKVHLGASQFDPIAGPIIRQREFYNILKSKGVSITFTNFGFTSHIPEKIRPNNYTNWIIQNCVD